MRTSIFVFFNICVGIFVQTPAFAYDCNDSDAYKSGRREISLVRDTTKAQMLWAVTSLQEAKGLTFDAALQEVVQVSRSEQMRLYDDQLGALETKINAAKRDSSQACDALLLLQRQYAHVGQQKINFVAKVVTGENFAVR